MSDFEVRVDFSEVTDLMARFPRIGPAAEAEAGNLVTRYSIEGEARYKRRVRKDTGHLRRSGTHRVDRRPGSITGRFGTNVPYGVVMEKGRRRGAPMPPKGVLLGWMRRKGIPAAAEFTIRRAISRKGIAGDHLLETIVKELAPLVRRDAAQIGPRLRAILAGGR